jgi:tripartite-type tricarboxylate transporter receptor subunit TctC
LPSRAGNRPSGLNALTVIALAVAVAAHEVRAQSAPWPSKSVRVIVPVAPGGGSDTQARLLTRKIGATTGQSFVIENRPGAGGVIGAELTTKASPDGYTMLFATASLAVNASLNKNIKFDPVRDLQPASVVSSSPLVLAVHPSMPARSIPEFVAIVRKRAFEINASSNGAGTTSHLALEMLNQLTGLKMTHIPFRGGVPSMTALSSGEVDFAFTTILTVQPFVKLNKVRALAVTTSERSSVMPELPTLKSAFPEFDIDNWYAFFLPAGASAAVVEAINAEIVKAVKSTEVIGYLKRDGGDPVGSSVADAGAHFKREVAKYAKIVKAGNLKAN